MSSSPSKSPTMEPPHPKAANSLSPPIKQKQQQFDEAESVEESDHHDEFSDEKTRLQKEKEAADANFLKSFPPGYRFNPHDEELVMYYLQKKIKGLPLPPNRIMEVNLYLHNPDTLAERYERYGEKEWYFFTPRDRKYPNGLRPNRAAGDGYWKATGADRPIRSDGLLVGYRKALVFYIGKAPKGTKTNWIMHEFRVSNSIPAVKRTEKDMRLDHWVLCRIYKKVGGKNNKIQGTNHEAEEPEEEEEIISAASSPEDMMKMEEMSSTTQQSYITNFNHPPMESVHANPNNYHSYHNYFGAGVLVHSTFMAHSNYSHPHHPADYHPALSSLEYGAESNPNYLYAGGERSMCTTPNNNVLHQTRFHQQFDNYSFPTMGQMQFGTSSSMDSNHHKCEDVHFPDQKKATELDDMPSSTHQEQELVDVKDDGQGFQDDLELWNFIEPGLLH